MRRWQQKESEGANRVIRAPHPLPRPQQRYNAMRRLASDACPRIRRARPANTSGQRPGRPSHSYQRLTARKEKKKNQRARPRHHHAFFFLTVPRPYAAPRSEKYHANSGTLCPAARIPTSRMPRKSPITPWRPSYDEESVRIRIGASYFPRKDNLPLDITDVSQEGGAGSSGYKCLRQGRAAEVGEKRR